VPLIIYYIHATYQYIDWGDCMKLKYIINDISEVLVQHYIKMRNVKVNQSKHAIMVLHMKQAIMDTYQTMYPDFDDVYSIDIYFGYQKTTCILGYEKEYDHELVNQMIDEMKTILNKTYSSDMFDHNDDVIIIHACPFDDMQITHNDIITLLDLDCI